MENKLRRLDAQLKQKQEAHRKMVRGEITRELYWSIDKEYRKLEQELFGKEK